MTSNLTVRETEMEVVEDENEDLVVSSVTTQVPVDLDGE